MDYDKIDRAFRSVVIDWLQYGEKFSEARAQNALTLIAKIEAENARLTAEIKRLHDKYDLQLLVRRNEALRKVVDAARECLWVDECRCDVAYTGRGRHEPNTRCGELDPIREALRELDGEKKYEPCRCLAKGCPECF